ncbi:MAG: hypothetical protein R3F59_12060 [Myxococcota bacterium]
MIPVPCPRAPPGRRPIRLPLRPVAPVIPVAGAVVDIRDVARDVLAEDAERFEARIERWSGSEDRAADGTQPYLAPQLRFAERPWRRCSLDDLGRRCCGAPSA